MQQRTFSYSPIKRIGTFGKKRLFEKSLLISVLIGLSNYLHAENNAYLANRSSDWLQIASLVEEERQPLLHLKNHRPAPRNSWAITFDNDFLVPGHRDQDYTYGLNFTQTGLNARNAYLSLNTPLKAMDDWLNIKHASSNTQESYSRELGAFGFTPEDISIKAAIPDDRPYASLVYLSSSREQIDLVENIALRTTFTVGALGLGLVGELQNLVHEGTSGDKAEGWDNQISEGGEVTARYVVARQKIIESFSDDVELKSTWQASIGYLTEASWSLSLRNGKIHSPWSSFNPELTSYGEKSSYSSSSKAINERYFWLGIAFKARAYNSFLQGQFRDSAVNYEHHQLNPFLIEAWAGYTFAFKQGYRISYVLRGHSSEINEGAGNRNLLWGGLILAKTI